MQSIDQPGSFIVAVLIFQLIPGPGTLAILRATGQYGMRAGFASVFGTLLGGLLCMLAAASGLEAVFRGQPEAMHLLQTAGSLYLAWIGWRLMKNRARATGAVEAATPGLARHARQALTVSLTNPKVILFYFALLPLFFRAPVTVASFGTMVGCVSGVSLLYQGGLVLAGNAAAHRLGRLPSARLLAQRLAGLALIGFAVKMLLVWKSQTGLTSACSVVRQTIHLFRGELLAAQDASLEPCFAQLLDRDALRIAPRGMGIGREARAVAREARAIVA